VHQLVSSVTGLGDTVQVYQPEHTMETLVVHREEPFLKDIGDRPGGWVPSAE
jgi:hypothetical protein